MSVYVLGPEKQAVVPQGTLQRVDAKHACPICSHTDWCEVSSDGSVHCMRVESDRPSSRAGGWWHHIGGVSNLGISSPPAKVEAAPIAPIGLRDRIYREILALCGLSAVHEAYLMGCGIRAASRGIYGTLNGNRNAVLQRLLDQWTPDLLRTIPGLWLDSDGLHLAMANGLLIVVCDTEGRISRMQCRVELSTGSKQYLWLSSSKYGGPSSGALSHCAPGVDSAIVWITEGVKKAEVTAQKSGHTTIGMSSHTGYTAGLAMLDSLISTGTLGVVVALDEDTDEHTRQLVDVSRQKIVAEVLARGQACWVARWDPARGKGIDDLLLAGHKPTLTLTTNPVEAASTGFNAKSVLCDDLVMIIGSALPDAEARAVAGARILLGGKPTELKRVFSTKLAAAAGMHSKSGTQKVCRSLADAGSRGVVERVVQHDDAGHSHLSIALNLEALPTSTDIVAPSPRAREAKERDNRRRCRGCGLTGLLVVCPHCGLREPLEAASAGICENPVDDLAPLIKGDEQGVPPLGDDLEPEVPIAQPPKPAEAASTGFTDRPVFSTDCKATKLPGKKYSKWAPYGDPRGIWAED
jgi:hypothetical protein